MSDDPSTRLLVLHGVRLLGFAPTAAVAQRFDLEPGVCAALLDEARDDGLLSWSTFGADSGWSLTEAGRAEDERLLAAELDGAGARPAVTDALQAFLPLNGEVTEVLTAVQLASPTPADESVYERLQVVARSWRPVETDLVAVLPRFGGYHRRFLTALFRADADPAWLTGTAVDSCHRVWFELHEDLLATLSIRR